MNHGPPAGGMSRDLLAIAASALAVLWSLEQIYVAAFTVAPTMIERPMHVVFALAIAFAMHPFGGGTRPASWSRLDAASRWLMVVATGGIGVHYLMSYQRLSNRIPYLDGLLDLDLVVGIALIALVLEAARRSAGLGLTVVTIAFIAYAFAGPWMPGALRHSGISLEEFIDLQAMSSQGIFGVPVGVSSGYVFYFILLAAFLEISGGGRLFIDFAMSAVGRFRGGSAKAAVVASSLFGTITGSAVANVSAVGVFTIPLMKRTGYSPSFAGAVEALASTGGQIMPPVMGAGAFILAQMVGKPYAEIALAAVIPAVLFYVSAYFMVDLQARKSGIGRLAAHQRPKLKDCLPRIHLVLPLLYLVGSIVLARPLIQATLESIALTVVLSFVHRAGWMTPTKVLRALATGGRGAVAVAVPCAAAGIIVGVTVQSGLGLKFSSLVVALAGSNLYVGLILVMIGCIVMGMGLPTTSAYILAAVLMVPALIELGANEIAAHLFVFYFACISMITPPVALAAYAAAGIAGARSDTTGWVAAKIGIAAYLVPFAFVLGPALVLQGPWQQILTGTATAALGVYALAGATIGHLRLPCRTWERVVLAAAAVALIVPVLWLSALGMLAFAIVVVVQRFRQSGDGPEAFEQQNQTLKEET
jgi:TRAP transporter 4TM/12TM fusion protein